MIAQSKTVMLRYAARSPAFEKAMQKLRLMDRLHNNMHGLYAVAKEMGVSPAELKVMIREHFKTASRLHLGPGHLDKNSEVLKRMKKFRKRLQGDLSSAIEVAAGLAKQTGKDMYCWQGNSYMNAIWNVSDREDKALGPFENIGQFVYRVTPGLDIYKHEVSGRPDRSDFGVEE